ncbi:hypothetical protein ACH46F_15195 [Streptomyces virginiae]|uniref:hypothetical protein n=1 Tax=Streptomyces virginiae TaxID=1961 RepID=UPI00378B17E4
MSKADPWGEDLQLALYLLYEVHYRGFDGVDDVRAWGPALLRLRRSMETRVLQALRAQLPDAPRTVEEAFVPLLVARLGHPAVHRTGPCAALRGPLEPACGPCLDHAPAPLLATVNLMSLFGLADIAFGCAATVLLEDRLATHLRAAWDQGRSALRTPLPGP